MTNLILPSEKWKLNYVILLVIALLITFIFTFLSHSFYLPDSYEYINSWKNLFLTDHSLSNIELTKRPFVYPLFVTLLTPIGTIISQNILTILVYLSMASLLDKTINNRRFILSMFIFTLAGINVFIYTHKIMTEVLVMSALWFAFFFQQKGKYISSLLLISLVPFIKPAFIFLPVFLTAFYFIKSHFKLNIMVLGMASSMFLIFTYMSWNNYRTGSFEFSSIAHINSLTYNKYQFDLNKFGEQHALRIQDSIIKVGAHLTYANKVKLYNSSLFQDVKSHPIAFTLFHLKGSFFGIIDPGRFDFQTLFPSFFDSESGFLHRENGGFLNYLKHLQWPILFILFPIALMNILRFVLAIIGFVTTKSNDSNGFAGIVILYLILISGPINASRFMVMVSPLIIYFACIGYNRLYQEFTLFSAWSEIHKN